MKNIVNNYSSIEQLTNQYLNKQISLFEIGSIVSDKDAN